jgi:hypothetical protein
MSTEGEKCLELVLFDDSNYESWCISILNNIEDFNPYLLSIVDSSICPPNITWTNLYEKERKCLKLNAQAICLLTQSLSPNVEALILKEHGVPMDAHLLWKYIKEKFLETTAVQDSREANCLAKSVRPVVKNGQAKSAGSRLQRRKCHRSNQNSASQTSSLPSRSHGKWLMAKGKQEKQPPRVESEEEEDKDDLEFDKLSKKDMIKIKRLIEKIKEQELQLEQQEEYLIGKIEEFKALHEEHEKLKHSHISLIDPLEKENANL